MQIHSAVKIIQDIKPGSDQTQCQARTEKFQELLTNEIKSIISSVRPRDDIGWRIVYTKAKTWFMGVVKEMKVLRFSPAAFNQYYYMIRNDIKEKGLGGDNGKSFRY